MEHKTLALQLICFRLSQTKSNPTSRSNTGTSIQRNTVDGGTDFGVRFCLVLLWNEIVALGQPIVALLAPKRTWHLRIGDAYNLSSEFQLPTVSVLRSVFAPVTSHRKCITAPRHRQYAYFQRKLKVMYCILASSWEILSYCAMYLDLRLFEIRILLEITWEVAQLE